MPDILPVKTGKSNTFGKAIRHAIGRQFDLFGTTKWAAVEKKNERVLVWLVELDYFSVHTENDSVKGNITCIVCVEGDEFKNSSCVVYRETICDNSGRDYRYKPFIRCLMTHKLENMNKIETRGRKESNNTPAIVELSDFQRNTVNRECERSNVVYRVIPSTTKSPRISFQCQSCGTIYERCYSSSCIFGCPLCSDERPRHFYVMHFQTKSGIDFIKYGITFDIDLRAKQHKQTTDSILVSVYSIQLKRNYYAIELEKECHELRNKTVGENGYVSKSTIGAHTETLPISALDSINDLVFENTMCKLKPLFLITK